MRMLLEHKEEIGYRSVERIVLFGYKGFVAGKEWEKCRTILIKLSEPRVPPFRRGWPRTATAPRRSRIPVLS